MTNKERFSHVVTPAVPDYLRSITKQGQVVPERFRSATTWNRGQQIVSPELTSITRAIVKKY